MAQRPLVDRVARGLIFGGPSRICEGLGARRHIAAKYGPADSYSLDRPTVRHWQGNIANEVINGVVLLHRILIASGP